MAGNENAKKALSETLYKNGIALLITIFFNSNNFYKREKSYLFVINIKLH
jgi:hypothetical protein